ncbi:ABC transporter substrate-binding protein [Micromonospora endophytica]|uniref:ABC transporter substrate-binding protein n=1 Tax=Micromonospora endophytica TaxID=515350 RepID=A0A2W2CN04_9ACTN|nr:ABC transporter substrate-binding protein [Micromonospora endophytica]PZF94494.1 ABC transporter substrate-binding protein [Micromonospora endophytica]RIW43899.1 ABC transporter substrate-binding protein [Micromonospora endophytica]BCJ56922.1 ABC transporter substrate-binding protein [Micromonospora endophytica]
MPRPRPLVAALAVSIALASASACGSDAGDSTSSETLRIGLSAESGVLDPHAFTGNFLLLDAIYEPLVSYGEEGRLEPGLARAWTVAEDGRQVSFDLRDGVRFTDGTPVDAAAVKWNFDRWVGNKRFSFFRASQVISSVEAVDADTVRLTLTEPYEPLLQELSIVRPVRLLSPQSAAPDGAFQNPVGTGAWKLGSQSATSVVLERNDDYWGPKPQLERLEFSVIPDSQARVDALTNGEIDLIGGAYLAPITPVEAKSLDDRDGITLLTGAPDVSIMLGFNPEGPAGDKAVREAVIRAIDTAALAKTLLLDYAEPARRVFPPDVPDSGDDLPLGFDKAAAGSLLDAAGYVRTGDTRAKDGRPLSLRLLIPATPAEGQLDPRTMAAAIAAALKEVGVGVEIAPVDAAAYYDERAEGRYDLTFFETLGAPYDPSSSIVSLFTSGARAPLWTTPAIEKLVDAALFAGDPAARGAAYQNLYRAVAADAGFVPLVYRPRLWAVRDAVAGFAVPPSDVDLELAGVTVG